MSGEDYEPTRLIRKSSSSGANQNDQPPANAGHDPEETKYAPSSLPGDGDVPDKTRIIRRSQGSDDSGEDSDVTRLVRPSSNKKESDYDPVVGWLVVIHGPGKGDSVSLGYGRNSIGRDKSNRSAIPYGDQSISRNNHATLTFDHKGSKFYIQQGESVNPIRVSDQIVLEPRELFGGEIIEISDATTLKFVPLCGESFSWEDSVGE